MKRTIAYFSVGAVILAALGLVVLAYQREPLAAAVEAQSSGFTLREVAANGSTLRLFEWRNEAEGYTCRFAVTYNANVSAPGQPSCIFDWQLRPVTTTIVTNVLPSGSWAFVP